MQLIVKTDLSNIKWFQSSILLQDKELIPHPASLCPLQQCWAPYMFLLCRRTQKAMRQKGQNAKSHGEQGPRNCWKMHSVSHRETRSSIWKDFSLFLDKWSYFLGLVFVAAGREKRKSTDESQILDTFISVNMCHPQVSNSATGYNKDISTDSRLFLYYWAFVDLWWAVYLCEPYNDWMRGFLLYWQCGVEKKWGEWVHVLQIFFCCF